MFGSGCHSFANSGFKGLYSGCIENGATEIGVQCGENVSSLNGLEWPSSLYYDLYQYENIGYYDFNQYYLRGYLGDATKEIGPFYEVKYLLDTNESTIVSSYFTTISHYVSSVHPWFVRGGHVTLGSNSGLSAYRSHFGNNEPDISFRIVLMPY